MFETLLQLLSPGVPDDSFVDLPVCDVVSLPHDSLPSSPIDGWKNNDEPP